MSYRKITVDGQEYQYTVGAKYVKIKGYQPIAIADIGSRVQGNKFIVGPQHIKAHIMGTNVDHAQVAHQFLVDNSVAKMKKIALAGDQDGDYLPSHIKADALLCDVLKELGFQALVDEYRNVGKWYV